VRAHATTRVLFSSRVANCCRRDMLPSTLLFTEQTWAVDSLWTTHRQGKDPRFEPMRSESEKNAAARRYAFLYDDVLAGERAQLKQAVTVGSKRWGWGLRRTGAPLVQMSAAANPAHTPGTMPAVCTGGGGRMYCCCNWVCRSFMVPCLILCVTLPTEREQPSCQGSPGSPAAARGGQAPAGGVPAHTGAD
jgi:hypothetical protein